MSKITIIITRANENSVSCEVEVGYFRSSDNQWTHQTLVANGTINSQLPIRSSDLANGGVRPIMLKAITSEASYFNGWTASSPEILSGQGQDPYNPYIEILLPDNGNEYFLYANFINVYQASGNSISINCYSATYNSSTEKVLVGSGYGPFNLTEVSYFDISYNPYQNTTNHIHIPSYSVEVGPSQSQSGIFLNKTKLPFYIFDANRNISAQITPYVEDRYYRQSGNILYGYCRKGYYYTNSAIDPTNSENPTPVERSISDFIEIETTGGSGSSRYYDFSYTVPAGDQSGMTIIGAYEERQAARLVLKERITSSSSINTTVSYCTLSYTINGETPTDPENRVCAGDTIVLTCTVKPEYQSGNTTNIHYRFDKWTKNGINAQISSPYTVQASDIVNNELILVANLVPSYQLCFYKNEDGSPSPTTPPSSEPSPNQVSCYRYINGSVDSTPLDYKEYVEYGEQLYFTFNDSDISAGYEWNTWLVNGGISTETSHDQGVHALLRSVNNHSGLYFIVVASTKTPDSRTLTLSCTGTGTGTVTAVIPLHDNTTQTLIVSNDPHSGYPSTDRYTVMSADIAYAVNIRITSEPKRRSTYNGSTLQIAGGTTETINEPDFILSSLFNDTIFTSTFEKKQSGGAIYPTIIKVF